MIRPLGTDPSSSASGTSYPRGRETVTQRPGDYKLSREVERARECRFLRRKAPGQRSGLDKDAPNHSSGSTERRMEERTYTRYDTDARCRRLRGIETGYGIVHRVETAHETMTDRDRPCLVHVWQVPLLGFPWQ